MRAMVALALVACSSKSESKPPPAAPAVTFAGCKLAPSPPTRPAPPEPMGGLTAMPPGTGMLREGSGGSGFGTLGHGAGPGPHGHAARATRVRLNTPVVTGGLDKNVIRRFLRGKGPQLQACYDRALATKPTLGGVVTIKLTIAGTGKVSTAETSGVDPALASCAGDTVRSIEFPAPQDGLAVQVTQEIAFKLDEPQELPWTPYAITAGDDDPAARVRVESAIEDIQAQIDACFGTAKGVLRAMIVPAKIPRVRVGGLGDPRVEDCVANALRAIRVPPSTVELACDFDSGGAAPWRISPTGYERVSPGAAPDEPAKSEASYLIVADRDTTGDKIDSVATWAAPGTIVAITVASDSGAPIFIGLSTSAQLAPEIAPSLGLAAKAGSVATCDGKDPVKIADPHALDARFAAIHEPVAFALSPTVTAKELVGLSSAATRANLQFRLGDACR